MGMLKQTIQALPIDATCSHDHVAQLVVSSDGLHLHQRRSQTKEEFIADLYTWLWSPLDLHIQRP